MADTPPALQALQLIEGDADGYCDAETGVCAVPAPTAAGTEPDAAPADEPLVSETP